MTGQAGPGITVPATWLEEQTQPCPIVVCLCFWLPDYLCFPEPSNTTYSLGLPRLCPPRFRNFLLFPPHFRSFLLFLIQGISSERIQISEWAKKRPNSNLSWTLCNFEVPKPAQFHSQVFLRFPLQASCDFMLSSHLVFHHISLPCFREPSGGSEVQWSICGDLLVAFIPLYTLPALLYCFVMRVCCLLLPHHFFREVGYYILSSSQVMRSVGAFSFIWEISLFSYRSFHGSPAFSGTSCCL